MIVLAMMVAVVMAVGMMNSRMGTTTIKTSVVLKECRNG